MRIIKLILSVVLLGVLGLGALFVAENRGMVQAGTFTKVVNSLKGPAASLSSDGVQNSVKMLSSQVGNQGSMASGGVLGANIVEKQETPLSQRAFEYARYNYCQAVVSDYQDRYSDSP